jgi:hypothetical protein
MICRRAGRITQTWGTRDTSRNPGGELGEIEEWGWLAESFNKRHQKSQKALFTRTIFESLSRFLLVAESC